MFYLIYLAVVEGSLLKAILGVVTMLVVLILIVFHNLMEQAVGKVPVVRLRPIQQVGEEPYLGVLKVDAVRLEMHGYLSSNALVMSLQNLRLQLK